MWGRRRAGKQVGRGTGKGGAGRFVGKEEEMESGRQVGRGERKHELPGRCVMYVH